MSEAELIDRAKAGDNAAKVELMRLHNGLICFLVRRFCRQRNVRDDYEQVARMAFIECIPSFDATRGAFTHFFATAVRQRLGRYRHRNTVVIRPYYSKQLAMLDSRLALGDYDGGKLDDKRAALDACIASFGGVESLDVPVAIGARMSRGDLLEAEGPSPEEQVIEAQERTRLREQLSKLPARHVDVLLRGQASLSEVGKKHGRSGELMRQVEKKAIRGLRRQVVQ